MRTQPNQSMERTAVRRGFTLWFAATSSLRIDARSRRRSLIFCLVRPMRTIAVLCLLLVFSADVTQAKIEKRRTLYSPRPEYPAFKNGKSPEGRGIFVLHIRNDGVVTGVSVIKSTGWKMLDDAAIVAFRKWRFARYPSFDLEMRVTFWHREGPDVRPDDPYEMQVITLCRPK
jgi:TonB family protein